MSTVVVTETPPPPEESGDSDAIHETIGEIKETVEHLDEELHSVEDSTPHMCDASCPCHEDARIANEAARQAMDMANKAHAIAQGIARFLCEEEEKPAMEEVTEIAPTPDTKSEPSDRKHNLWW